MERTIFSNTVKSNDNFRICAQWHQPVARVDAAFLVRLADRLEAFATPQTDIAELTLRDQARNYPPATDEQRRSTLESVWGKVCDVIDTGGYLDEQLPALLSLEAELAGYVTAYEFASSSWRRNHASTGLYGRLSGRRSSTYVLWVVAVVSLVGNAFLLHIF